MTILISSTYDFALTRDALIASALRTLEVYGAGETPSATDITNCAEALNILVKAMAMDGLPLWCVQEIHVPLVAGQIIYYLGTLPGTICPARVLQAAVRDVNLVDRQIELVSIFDWERQSNKFLETSVTQVCFEPGMNDGLIRVYGAPSDSLSTLVLVAQQRMQDINLAIENPNFPPEAYQMLKWCLADEIALEYGAKPMKMQVCAAKAASYRSTFNSFNQDSASAYFLPSGRKE